jgi:predicted MFS family arabinose efflux permease
MSQNNAATTTTAVSDPTTARKQPSSVFLRIFAICLTSVVVAVHYTNYGPLIPTLISQLHITKSQAGLLSTFLFLGLIVMYIPAGILADRFGQRPVLITALGVIVLGSILLPLSPNLPLLLLCRFIIGMGVGAAFVAGAGMAAMLGKYSASGQGLYGGSIQIGSGLGLLLAPILLAHTGWRGVFLCCGLLSVLSLLVWLFVSDGHKPLQAGSINVGAGLRSRAVWSLGLSHMGTFGVGNAVAAWYAVYLAYQYGLSLGLAATLGSLVLLLGAIARPFGGILIGRGVMKPIPLLRLGTILTCLGVALLAIPLRFAPLAAAGMACIGVGATIPYTSVFNEAAHFPKVSKGIAQGLASMISTPAIILGAPLIGLLYGQTGNFTLAFTAIALFGLVAITASFLAGPAVKHETS